MNGSESLQNDQSAATENALRRAVDTTPAFIHTARPDGYLDYFNHGWLDFLGKSLEDVCGWRWTESVHPEDVATLVQKWHAALASGEPLEVESRVRRADGSYRAFLHRKLPLRDEHGNIVKWYGSSIDIEDRRRAEQKNGEKTNKLERSEFYLREGERLAHMGSWIPGMLSSSFSSALWVRPICRSSCLIFFSSSSAIWFAVVHQAG